MVQSTITFQSIVLWYVLIHWFNVISHSSQTVAHSSIYHWLRLFQGKVIFHCNTAPEKICWNSIVSLLKKTIFSIVFHANASQYTQDTFSGIIISVLSHKYFFINNQSHSKQLSGVGSSSIKSNFEFSIFCCSKSPVSSLCFSLSFILSSEFSSIAFGVANFILSSDIPFGVINSIISSISKTSGSSFSA